MSTTVMMTDFAYQISGVRGNGEGVSGGVFQIYVIVDRDQGRKITISESERYGGS